MKKFYVLFVFFIGICGFALAQTNPSPQILPFSLTAQTGSTLPDGVAVHRFGTAAGSIPTTRTLSPGNADLPYNSNSTSGGWKDEGANGISLLASGSNAAGALVVSINTVGITNIQVGWTVRLILQQASRDNSIALQYRVGTTGNFIDVGTTSTFNSQGKAVNDFSTFTETLPTGAENQSEVQVRWIYWESNSPSGSRDRLAIDDISITGTGGSIDVTAPTITGVFPADEATGVAINSTATITFNETVQKGTGNIYVRRVSDDVAIQTIDVTTAAVTVASNKVSFGLTLTNSTAYYIEIDAGAFKDLSKNNFAGINGNSIWNFTSVAPPGVGIIGTTYNFNTCSNYINEGFTTYSVTGAQVWTCVKFGRTYTTDPSTDSAIQMNGFVSGAQTNEDWLISPRFDLTGTNIPLIDFYSRSNFSGPSLSLRVSTNYNGTGDPNSATWTTVYGGFPTVGSNVWTLSDSINLSAFKTSNVSIAWVYTSTTAGASQWTIDDILVYNSSKAPLPFVTSNFNLLDFREVAFGTTSPVKTFTFTSSNLIADITLTAPAGYQLSKDGTSFSNTITYTMAEAEGLEKTVSVRFTPTAANATFAGYINFSSTDVNQNMVFVKGNSYPLTTTLNVVNWNIEWFGDANLGPTDNNLQEANAKKIMEYLDADVFALAEIVDTARLGNLTRSLAGGYNYVVANFGAGLQKQALVYKTSVLSNVTSRLILATSTSAVANWSTGRVPLLVTADATKNGGLATAVSFIVVHAKANTGSTAEQIESYNRRKAGIQELKDTLDAFFANDEIIILGDYNDDLDRTIAPTTGADTVSSYQVLIADSTDANSYRAVTLPLSLFKQQSTTSFPDVIDHVTISNELAANYIMLSATIYSDIATLAGITNFATTTSDHYPIMTRYLLSTAAPLPVKLTDFTATKHGSAVLLAWKTTEEINSKEFLLERSANGQHFTSIGKVAAAGNSSAATNYQYTDVQPLTGNNFYRLRMVDMDGKAALSKVAKIAFDRTYIVTLWPNPAKGSFTVTATTNEPIHLQIVDMNGRIVKAQRITNVSEKVMISHLIKGVYSVRLQTATGLQTHKLVVD